MRILSPLPLPAYTPPLTEIDLIIFVSPVICFFFTETATMSINMDSIKNFSLFTSWPSLERMEDDEFDDFLKDLGLLWKSRKCRHCSLPCVVTRESNGADKKFRVRFECTRRGCRKRRISRKIGYLKDTFFENLHGPRKKIFLASVLFVDDMGCLEDRARHCCVNKNTITQRDQWFCDVIVESFLDNSEPRKIGGPGVVMQVDETYIVKRKYNCGRRVRDSWMIGGIVNDSKEIFVEITSSRDSTTLENIITKHVLPGTIIYTDSWRGYSNLSNLGYIHKTVNHSEHFVDPTSGVHTQRIENTWSNIKRLIKRRNGLKGALWDDNFLEAVWKYKHNNDDRLFLLWTEIRKKYPLVEDL